MDQKIYVKTCCALQQRLLAGFYIRFMDKVIILSFITAAISFTVSETKIFKPLRELTKSVPFLGELLSCGYCIGHWIAFGLTAMYQPKIIEFFWLLDYFLTALVIAWFAGLQWIIMCWFMKKAGK